MRKKAYAKELKRLQTELVVALPAPSDREKTQMYSQRYIAEVQGDGILLIKYWLEVSNEEQKKRFEARIGKKHKQWKLSPMDLEARSRWYDYSRARDVMLDATDTEESPWHIVRNEDKLRGRLNGITHLLPMTTPPA